MRKHWRGIQLLIVLCVLTVFLAGCRPSPILEQIIYEQNHEVNPDTETKAMDDDPENEEQDEDIPSRETVDDSEQTKGEAHTAALAGDEDTSDETDAVYDVAYAPSGDLSEPDETNPTEGSASEEATGSTEAGGDEGGTAPAEEGQPGGTDDTSGDQSNENGGSNSDLDDDNSSKDGSSYTPDPETSEPKHIIDATGREVEVPENVGTVTAVGEIATIVEMLGGDNRLLASSNSFKANQLAMQAFASQGAENVYEWWDGDGSTSACKNIGALVEAHPDVCFEISGEDTFDGDQITALDAAGIAYVLLYPLDTITHIQDDVTLVGQVLGNNPDYNIDSESIARNYCDWTNNVVNQSSGGNQKATVYIDRWDDDASWTITETGGEVLANGKGAPVSMKTSGVFAECMNDVNLINTAVNNYFVEPLRSLYWMPSITRTSAKFDSGTNIIHSDELGVGLGNDAFPAVIVENSDIKDMICDQTEGTYGYYHWQTGEWQRMSDNVMAYGFHVVGDGGEPLRTWIESEYEVWVNPDGLGNWTGGSAESPLEVAWLGCKFQNNVSMNQVRSWVSEFYSTFYHYDVNPSNILGE